MAPSRTVVASLLVLLSTHSLAFVVHKRSTYNTEEERGELKEALKLLERQRRRLDDIDVYGSEEPQQWWPSEQSEDDDLSSDIDEAQYVPPADGYLQSIFPPGEEGHSFPYNDNTDDYRTTDKQSGEDYRETPVPADMHELEDVLDDDDTKSETKRSSGVDLSMEADDQQTENKENKVQEMDPEMVKKLLAEADKVESDKVNEYAKEETVSTVSPDELKNMLDGEEEKEPETERKKKDDTEDAQGEVGAYLEPSVSGDVKKKRSGGGSPLPGDASETTNSVDLNYIKKLILLEDRENTNLAQALNYATLAQLDKSGKYLPKEIEYLRNAITDEAELQNILTDVVEEEGSPIDEEDGEDKVGNEPILQRKRADPQIVDRPGLEDLSPSDREKAVILSYLLRKGAPQDDEDVDPRDTSENEPYRWLNAPVRDSRDFQGKLYLQYA